MVPIGNGDQYDITLHAEDGKNRVYRTQEVLSEPTSARGKGTWVWKAVSLEEGVELGEPVVLKDCWMERGRPSEGDIMERICATLRPPLGHDQPSLSLLTIECHGDVFLDDSRDVLDCTRSLGDMAFAPYLLLPVSGRSHSADGSTTTTESTTTDEDDVSHRHWKTPIPRSHYRIVFKELCTPLSDETSPVTIFSALANATDSE